MIKLLKDLYNLSKGTVLMKIGRLIIQKIDYYDYQVLSIDSELGTNKSIPDGEVNRLCNARLKYVVRRKRLLEALKTIRDEL